MKTRSMAVLLTAFSFLAISVPVFAAAPPTAPDRVPENQGPTRGSTDDVPSTPQGPNRTLDPDNPLSPATPGRSGIKDAVDIPKIEDIIDKFGDGEPKPPKPPVLHMPTPEPQPQPTPVPIPPRDPHTPQDHVDGTQIEDILDLYHNPDGGIKPGGGLKPKPTPEPQKEPKLDDSRDYLIV